MNKFILVIPVKDVYQPLLRRSIESLLHGYQTGDMGVHDLKQAASEAFNFIKGVGPLDNKAKIISVTATVDAGEAKVTLEDNSNLTISRSVIKKINDGKLPGDEKYSFTLMNNLTDELLIDKGLNGGVRMRFRKFLKGS